MAKYRMTKAAQHLEDQILQIPGVKTIDIKTIEVMFIHTTKELTVENERAIYAAQALLYGQYPDSVVSTHILPTEEEDDESLSG